MKHRFCLRLGALLMAGGLLIGLSSCSQPDGPASGSTSSVTGTQSFKGRYVETQLDLPEAASSYGSLVAGTDGTIYLYSREGRYRLDEAQEPPVLVLDETFQTPLSEAQSFVAADHDEQGEVYLAYTEDDALQIARVKEGGMEPLPQVESAETWVSAFRVLPGGGFLLGSYNGLTLLEPDGTLRSGQEFPVMGAGIWEGQAAALVESRESDSPPAVIFFDPSNGDETGRVPCGEISAYPTTLVVSQEKGLYLCNEKGLYQLNNAKEGFERRIAPDRSSLSVPTYMQGGAAFMKNGDLIVLLSGVAGPGGLFRYRLDPKLSEEAEKTLRIDTIFDAEILHVAIPEFIRSHPEVQPEIRILLDRSSGAELSDIVKSVNTELLAGKGADLYVLDYLPLQAFQNKGVLMDLTQALAPLRDQDALMENVLGCYSTDGKLTAVPLCFQVPVIYGGEELTGRVKTLSDLADYAQENTGTPLFADNSAERLLDTFFPVCAPNWLHEDGLDAEGFAAFLENIKRIADLYPAPEQDAYRMDLVGLYQGENLAAVDELEQASSLLRNQAIQEQAEPGGYILLPGEVENVFMPRLPVGVNAGSPLAAEAADYVKLLLSAEVQGANTVVPAGLPVNREALAAEVAGGPYQDGVIFSLGGDFELSVDHWLDADSQSVFLALCDSLKTPGAETRGGNKAYGVLWDAAQGFFSGADTAQQAAMAAKERLQAVLQE